MLITKPVWTALWKTEVGSRMWGMDTYASDYDWFTCFQVPTHHILEGYSIPRTKSKQMTFHGKPVDDVCMEVGHFINLILKGNVNMIWAICSPLHYIGDKPYHELKKIVENNLSGESYHSIHGMAFSQWRDVERRADVRDPNKSRATALRTLKFGHELLQNGKIRFEPVADIVTDEEIKEAFDKLDTLYNTCSLPSKVPEEPFREWLLKQRLSFME